MPGTEASDRGIACLDRRDLIRLASGAAVAWPVALYAEDAAAPVIGFLDPRPSADAFAEQLAGFRRGLRETGFVEGENLGIVFEWGDNQFERLPALVNKLLRQPLAAIVASGGSRVALAAKEATSNTSVVFLIADDPVKLGLVASLNRPGGNLTGVNYFNVELYAKRLELLRKLVPKATRVAVLVNPTDPATMTPAVREVEAAAPAMSLGVEILKASTDQELEAAFERLREPADVLYIGGDVFLHSRRARIAALAAAKRIPAAYPQREWVEAGGLMSYGTNFPEMYRQAGIITGRILNGARPGELPVMQPSRFELVININAATILDLPIPATILALADEVIE